VDILNVVVKNNPSLIKSRLNLIRSYIHEATRRNNEADKVLLLHSCSTLFNALDLAERGIISQNESIGKDISVFLKTGLLRMSPSLLEAGLKFISNLLPGISSNLMKNNVCEYLFEVLHCANEDKVQLQRPSLYILKILDILIISSARNFQKHLRYGLEIILATVLKHIPVEHELDSRCGPPASPSAMPLLLLQKILMSPVCRRNMTLKMKQDVCEVLTKVAFNHREDTCVATIILKCIEGYGPGLFSSNILKFSRMPHPYVTDNLDQFKEILTTYDTLENVKIASAFIGVMTKLLREGSEAALKDTLKYCEEKIVPKLLQHCKLKEILQKAFIFFYEFLRCLSSASTRFEDNLKCTRQILNCSF